LLSLDGTEGADSSEGTEGADVFTEVFDGLVGISNI
jgi:hypothetical protein